MTIGAKKASIGWTHESAPFLRHGLFSARVQPATALEVTGLQPGQPGERFVQVGEYTRTVGALR
jgi:hypothetical protein